MRRRHRREDEPGRQQFREDLPRLHGMPFEESAPVADFRRDHRFEPRDIDPRDLGVGVEVRELLDDGGTLGFDSPEFRDERRNRSTPIGDSRRQPCDLRLEPACGLIKSGAIDRARRCRPLESADPVADDPGDGRKIKDDGLDQPEDRAIGGGDIGLEAIGTDRRPAGAARVAAIEELLAAELSANLDPSTAGAADGEAGEEVLRLHR